MKIGLICPYNIVKGGGVQEGVLAIQRELKTRGHDAKIITPLPRKLISADWPNVIFIGTATDIKSPFATTAQVSVSLRTEEIEEVLEREAFDVLHFHEPWVPMMSRQVLSRSQSVNIATFHAHLPGTAMSKTIEAIATPYTASILKYLHGLTAVSEAAAEYAKTLTEEPIVLIPNGIETKKYQSVVSKPIAPQQILFIGRLEKRKGVKYLLRAFALLLAAKPEVRLVIAGDGPDRARLERLVHELGLTNVSFVGYVDENAKLKLLHESTLFCSPAIYGESFGIVLLEAMAAGVPIVAGDNPGYTSVLRERGMLSLVNPKDSADFARRLQIFLDDQDLRSSWLVWAKRYVKQFDYSQVVDQYEALYKRLVKEARK